MFLLMVIAVCCLLFGLVVLCLFVDCLLHDIDAVIGITFVV